MDKLSELKGSLKEKLTLLEEVLDVTREQQKLIMEDNTDGLLQNIGERQKLLDELDEIQAELPDKEVMRQDSECTRLVVEITQTLKQIQAQDALNEKAANEQLARLRDQIKRVEGGMKMTAGYNNLPKDLGATYFDKLN